MVNDFNETKLKDVLENSTGRVAGPSTSEQQQRFFAAAGTERKPPAGEEEYRKTFNRAQQSSAETAFAH